MTISSTTNSPFPVDLYLTFSFNPFQLPYLEYNLYTIPALKRSKARWAWFTEAQHHNPAFGTLSYLPPEIRSFIWQNLVRWETRPWWPGPWMIFRPDIDKFEANKTVANLRKAAPLISLEIDQLFLATQTLHFHNFNDLRVFSRMNLAPWHIPWVRHFSFTIGAANALGPHWVQWFESELPPGVQTITLDIVHVHSARAWWENQSPDIAFVGLAMAEGRILTEREWEQGGDIGVSNSRMDQNLALLKRVMRTIARVAPAATILLGNQNKDCSYCHDYCKEILLEVKGIRVE